jgi:2,4-dienoyl-CoA reductase-like NADH-dependent reductase (Old Yellow Enzyme family)
LFSPLNLGPVELANRVTISAMCQYSAVDGCMGDWHLLHIGSLSLSGASLFMIESTGVVPEGRISHGCLGLYTDDQEKSIRRVLDLVRKQSPIKIGIQLGHAGRKASAHLPWEGQGALKSDERAWPTVAPSSIALGPGWPMPEELDRAALRELRNAYVAAAHRAARAGIDVIEFHSSHGYLIAQFLSPVTNKRTDEYGGNAANRMRFPLEVFSAIRSAWPADRALGAKITGSEFVDGGLTPEDAVTYSRALQDEGCDYVTVSGGGIVLDAKVPVAPGYQVPFAEKVKRETGIVTGAVGLISDPRQAEKILQDGDADFVAIARAMLFNPRWAKHAAALLGESIPYPLQYSRAQPQFWKPGATLGHLS